MDRGSSNRGFTLIELLVVIAIIAILAAILFPVFAQAKMAAKKSADLSNLKQITTSLAIYTSDYDDLYPYLNFQNGVGSPPERYRWSSSLCLGPYIKNTKIFSTPGDYQIEEVSTFPLSPMSRQKAAKTNSYMANGILPYINLGIFPAPYDSAFFTGVFPSGYINSLDPGAPGLSSSSTTGITNPAEIIMLASGAIEANTAAGIPLQPNFGPNTEVLTYWEDMWDITRVKDVIEGTVLGVPNTKMKTAWTKFNGVSNFAFPDGHAKSFSPKALKVGPYLDPKRFIRDAQ